MVLSFSCAGAFLRFAAAQVFAQSGSEPFFSGLRLAPLGRVV
jgi:hypothetical protein